ncbi:MAG: DUF2945 domain-containing protein [Parvibaculaceae bacterium]
MAERFETGSAVRWHWGEGTAEGVVRKRFTKRIVRTIRGAKIVRQGSDENPAYLIEQQDGGKVLKSHSELEPAG